MAIEILMPALSPTMEEGTLAKWLVAEGDKVSSGDILAEIETDKATMEFEAVDEGTIGKILIPEGTENVTVNTAIAILLEDGEMSERMKQKVLYIYNSFQAGINYCKEHYSNFAMKDTTSTKPLYLFKSKPLSSVQRDQEYSIPSGPESVSVYLMMNTEADGRAFCVNKERSIYIYPEPWSIIMIPDNLSHSEGINANNDLYYLKTKFELGPEKLQCSNLL